MALYIRVVNGDVESVGPLPVRARRLDTGELVDPSRWLRACGFYDVDTATVDDLPDGLTLEQREAIVDAVQAARQRRTRRRQLIQRLRTMFALYGQEAAWAWLDDYTSQSFPGTGDEPGTVWNGLTAVGKLEQVRNGVSLALFHNILTEEALQLIVDALGPLLDDADVDPPDPR